MINLKQERADFEKIGNSYVVADNVTREDVTISGVNCAWFTLPGADENDIVFYIHGGGFIYGSLNSHAPMVSYIASELNRKVLAIGYRLAPEHPFPAGIDDCVAVINSVVNQNPQISFGIIGDSAGGNFTMATQLVLKATNRPMPQYSTVISPWIDMTRTYESYERNRAADTVLSKEYILSLPAMYAPGQDLSNPLLSPIKGDLQGLSPVLVMCGTHEILQDDSIHLQQRLQACGVEAELEQFEGELHVWPFMNISSEGSRKALRDIARFAAKHSIKNITLSN